MKPYLTVSADVLIVGGGSAGVMAAIRAKQMDPKQKVVVFETVSYTHLTLPTTERV